MRRTCQWLAAALLVAGCSGTPAERPGAGSAPAAGVPRAAAVGHLPAGQARAYLAANPGALLLDVRNPDEWNDDLGHIEGARLIPLPELPARLAEIADWRERPVVVVCRSGRRSQRAAQILVGAGHRQVMNLEGGMIGWRQTEGAAAP